MSVAAVSDRGRSREENQDRSLATRARGVTLLAVADGVAGEAGGAVAATAAIDALASSFEFAARDGAAALAAAVRDANDAVLRATRESGHPHAATTLVAASVRGRTAAIANLGDSRAYLVRGAAARQVTDDHSGATPRSITRFLGDPRGVAPDVFVEPLRPRDRLVLCSDGLTLHVTADEIAARSRGAPERAARALVDLANERGGEDNVTVVVYAAPRRLWPYVLAAVVVAIALGALTAAALLTGR